MGGKGVCSHRPAHPLPARALYTLPAVTPPSCAQLISLDAVKCPALSGVSLSCYLDAIYSGALPQCDEVGAARALQQPSGVQQRQPARPNAARWKALCLLLQ